MGTLQTAGTSIAAGLLALTTIACESSPKTESSADGVEQPAEPELEMADELRPWLLHDRIGMIAKVDPSDWGDVEPYTDRLPRYDTGSGSNEGEMAGRRFVEFVEGQIPIDGLSEGIDETRPAWVALEPNTRTPAETCQQVGLPCMLTGGLSPRFMHGFLPADAPENLRSALEPFVRMNNARVVERGDWMHVVFLLGRQKGPFGADVAIEERTGDPPSAPEDPRITPAMATALGDTGPLSIWFDLRSAIDFGVRIGHTEVADVLQKKERGQFRSALAGTGIATAPLEFDRSRAAEFEDVGLVVGGDGEGEVWFDGVATQTSYGSELAGAGARPSNVSEVALEGSQIGAEWGYDVQAVREKLRRGVGLAGEPDTIAEHLRNAAFWGYLGFLRGLRTYADATIRASGLTLPTVLAADFRASVEEGASPEDLRAAAAIRVVRNRNSQDVYQGIQRLASGSEAGRIDRSEVDGQTGGEREEWRVAVRAPNSDEVFGDASERSGLNGSLSSEAVGPLLETLPEWFGRGARAIQRSVRALGLAETAMSVDTVETRRYAAMRLLAGDVSETAPAVVDVRLEPEQPSERCLARAGDEIRDILEEASDADKPTSALDRQLRDHEEAFAKAVDACVEAGTETEAEREVALSAYAVTRALVAYRLGHDAEADQLLQTACDGAFDWACSPDFYGDWPWTRIEESTSVAHGEASGEQSEGASESEDGDSGQ